MRLRSPLLLGVLGLVVFELASLYLVMPAPGSQRVESVALAHALYRARWPVRVACGALMLAGLRGAWHAGRRWRAAVVSGLFLVAATEAAANFVMSADHMFKPPRQLILRPAAQSQVPHDAIVVGVALGGEARAYPLRFIGYHHQVADQVGGQEVLVTYCTVCRTGRVFSPRVDGRIERFRLVGMDLFNAMLEDESTGSWWRQATGVAVAGPRKGMRLAALPSLQLTLAEWLALHPQSLVMQADPASASEYPKDDAYEKGSSRKTLTGTSPESWKEKSWVVGISLDGHSKAYDWNRLRRERAINDVVGGHPIVLVLAADQASFFAFERPDAATRFELVGGELVSGDTRYALSGRGPAGTLTPVAASQEFWHSWRVFHPDTERY
jgi:hypothetical protein